MNIEEALEEMLELLKVSDKVDTGNYQYDRGFSMAASFVIRDVERILSDYNKDKNNG